MVMGELGQSGMQTLQDWLAHCERLHPKAIALGLDRVRMVSQRLGLAFGCPVVTVAGTNGKGSTCAMLESIALQAGWRTGVYTSPHLVHFEERCRVRGEAVAADALVPHFERVEAARQDVQLTYFEFTTLAILSLLAASTGRRILEVGLGGRLDAVNIIDTDCAVITSIDLDHRSSWARTARHRPREGRHPARRQAGHRQRPGAAAQRAAGADKLGADLWLLGRDFNFSGDKQQWGWAGRGRRYSGLAYPGVARRQPVDQCSGVLAALTALRDRLPVTAQAVRNGLAMVELPGRFQQVPGQPALVLDVAHNPHSVAALAANLDAMGFFPTTHAVFGAMGDKDLAAMLRKMDPLVDRWYFADLPTRAPPPPSRCRRLWQSQTTRKDVPSSTHSSPEEALRAAVAAADPTDRILVFGSFYTVGGILKDGVPRLQARHLGS
jgi:dihydrofolate synthase/folylpolyglutamate synthase